MTEPSARSAVGVGSGMKQITPRQVNAGGGSRVPTRPKRLEGRVGIVSVVEEAGDGRLLDFQT